MNSKQKFDSTKLYIVWNWNRNCPKFDPETPHHTFCLVIGMSETFQLQFFYRNICVCFLFVCFFSYLKSLFYCPPLNKLFLGALFCFINFKRFLEKKAFKEFFVCLFANIWESVSGFGNYTFTKELTFDTVYRFCFFFRNIFGFGLCALFPIKARNFALFWDFFRC